MNNHLKIIGLSILSVLIAIVIMVSVILVVNFPRYYPDYTLALGERAVSFFEKITLPIKIARLSWLPADEEVLMPVYDIKVREVQDSWMSPRPDGRSHEGQDIFAEKGTPVFSGTEGYITRFGVGDLGGKFVYVAGAGGRRYYYAHFDRIADGLSVGQKVTTDSVVGFVGNTGNAEGTPPHLHFGIYALRKAINPLPFLVNRL